MHGTLGGREEGGGGIITAILDNCVGIAISVFFVVSGYYFFYGSSFDRKCYWRKIKGRISTLLVPYVFWNFSTSFVFFLVYLTYSDLGKFSKDILFRCFAVNSVPPNGPLWFVRDLIIFALFSPVIYWIIRNLKLGFVSMSGVIWIIGQVAFPNQYFWHQNLQAVFFFFTGAFFSLYNRIFLADFERWRLFSFVGYPVCVVLDFLTGGHSLNAVFHCLSLSIGVLFTFNLTSLLMKSEKIKINAFLLSVNFFLFVSHSMIGICLSLVPQSWRSYGNYPLELWYSFSAAVMILIPLGCFYMLRRFFPQFTAIIIGKRLNPKNAIGFGRISQRL
jgi:hypothetical protein